MKNVWFHILYFYKEDNGVRFTVYMDGRSQYVERFYCFPLKNHFLGQAWGNTLPLLPWPLSMTHTASPSLNDRKGGQSVQAMFTEESGIYQALLSVQVTGERETVPALIGLGDGCRAALQCSRAQSQWGEKDVQ